MTAVIYCLLFTELVWVGWTDLQTKKISNGWILVNAVLAFVFYLLKTPSYEFSWGIFIFPLATLLVGFILFLIDVMGAGDSKFLASLFLTIPIDGQNIFLKKLILSTIITGTLLLAYRIFKQGPILKAYLISRHWGGLKKMIGSRFSYAPVIGVAWLLLGLELWG